MGPIPIVGFEGMMARPLQERERRENHGGSKGIDRIGVRWL